MHNFSKRAPQTKKEIKREFFERYRKFHGKAQKALRRRATKPSDDRTLNRLLGFKAPYPVLIASNARSRWAVAVSVYKGARRLRKIKSEYEFAHVTIILDEWATSDERTELNLKALRRRARYILSQISEHYVAYVELQVFANVKAAGGGKLLSLHVHALAFGAGTLAQAARVKETLNNKLGPQNCGVQAIDFDPIVQTDGDLLRVARYGLKAVDRCKTLYIGKQTNLHESEMGDRYIRYLRMLEIQSIVPLRSLVFASGDGKSILNTALRQARVKLKRDAGPHDGNSQHEIASFWADLLRRLGHTRFRDPVVK